MFFPAHLGLIMVALTGVLAPVPGVHTLAPRIAPAQFATSQYGLTFRTPKSATYCPLPKNWVGSDHGTTVFLEKPKRCGGAGYPSSSRGFEPADLARLELFYSYRSSDDELPVPPCRRVASVMFLGARSDVCEERHGTLIIRTVTAHYRADDRAAATAQAVFTLTTRADRLAGDWAVFRQAAATFRTCSSALQGLKGPFTTGVGARCSKASRWF